MNRRFQKKLAACVTPPPPVGKAAFLARLPQPTLSLGQFVGGQARYIQKQTWLLSLVVLVPVLWGTDLWITAALLPFLVPLAVSEGAKSTLYGMEELETASRFSRKSVLLARLCLIGTFHAVLLLALTLLLGGSQGLSAGPLPAHRLGQPVALPPAPGAGSALRGHRPGRAGQRQLQRRRLSGRRLVCPGGAPLVELGGCPAGGGPHRGRHRLCQTDQGGHMELVIRNLTKQYPNKLAVDGVNLTLRPGVYGLLGANGAGKTTLMRMLCGILHPTGGGITLDGLTVDQEDYRASLGYLPQDFGYYPGFTGMDFLLYLGALKGLPRPQAKARAAELLDLVGLSEVAKRKLKTYSGGMKQRLGIAQALLNHPQLLILDEPTAGLDPKERVRFRDLIAQWGEHCIVLLSTHIVSDIAHIADVVLLMKEGRIIHNGPAADIDDLEAFYLRAFGEEGPHA